VTSEPYNNKPNDFSTNKYYANRQSSRTPGGTPKPSPAGGGPVPAVTAAPDVAAVLDVDLEDLASRVADKLSQHFGDMNVTAEVPNANVTDGAHAACDMSKELAEVDLPPVDSEKEAKVDEDDCPY